MVQGEQRTDSVVADAIQAAREHWNGTMGNTVEITMTLRHAMLFVFTVGFMAGSAGGMFLITMGDAPSGAITADTVADTADSNDNETAAADNESQPSQQQTNDTAVDLSNLTFEDDPVLGDADAPVTIVEFSDYQCPYCRSFARETFPQLKKNYIDTGTVRFVYKDFPLRQYHPKAVPMARAASCAGDQDRYWAMHDKLFDAQQNISGRRTARFDKAKIPQWANETGLDMDTFDQCFNSSAYKVEVGKDFQEARSIGVSSTPTFVVYRTGSDTGTTVVGAHPYSKFQSVISDVMNTSDGTQNIEENKQVDKTVTVSGTEYSFSPSTITVTKDQTVRVEFTNTGRAPHDLRIPALGVGTRTIHPGKTDSFTFTAPTSGTFPIEFICSVPGHEERGMTGELRGS